MAVKFSDYDILPKETCVTLEALERVTSLMVEACDARDALERIGRVLTDVLHAGRWSIMLKTELDTIRISLAKGLPKQVIDSTYVRLGEGIAGRVAERRPGGTVRQCGIRGRDHLGWPLQFLFRHLRAHGAQGEVLGVINLSDKMQDQGGTTCFNPRDLTLALLTANQAALMIEMLRISEAARGHLVPSTDELQSRDQSVLMQASAFDLLSKVTDLMVISGSLDQVLDAVIHGSVPSAERRPRFTDAARRDARGAAYPAAIGIAQEVIAAVCIHPGEGIAGRVLETGEALLVANAPRLRLGSNEAASSDRRAAQYRNRTRCAYR
jgi:hypothetical protein